MKRLLLLLPAVLLLGVASVRAQSPLTGNSQISTGKVYTITTADRGAWYAAPGGRYLESTLKEGVAVDPTSPAQHFAFVADPSTPGGYLLYSVGEGKFLTRSGSYVELAQGPDATSRVNLEATDNTAYPTVVALNSTDHTGVSNGHTHAIIFYQSLTDAGNQAQVLEVGDFGAADAAAAAAQLTPLFSASPSFAQATWYYLRNGNDNARYALYDASTADSHLPLTAANEGTDAYKWAFVGSPMEGYKVMNKAAGPGKYLHHAAPSNGEHPTMSATARVWDFLYGMNEGEFSLRGGSVHLNDYAGLGKLSFWEGGPKADRGSCWTVELAEDPLSADTLPISMANGTLIRTDGSSSAWRDLWQAGGSLPFTLRASANNMSTISGTDDIDLRSGSALTSTYTLSAPAGWVILGYTIRGAARSSSPQTITPAGQTGIVFDNTAIRDEEVSLASPARQTTFVLTGANTGLAATIAVFYTPAPLTVADAVNGPHTAGRGTPAVMLRATLTTPASGITLNSLTVDLPDGTETRVSHVQAYVTAEGEKEFHATLPTAMGGTAPSGATATIPLSTGNQLEANTAYNLWITLTPSADAPQGSLIDAALTGVDYTEGGTAKHLALHLNPEGRAKVFKQQQYLFVPTSHDCKYYRIPALIRAADNSLVAVADKRYNSEADLGNHKIDLVVRRSENDGQTWSEPHVFAEGDGTSATRYGFGDAALARTASGKLICLMSAGSKSFWQGQTPIFMSTSENNGQTWSEPVEISVPGRMEDQVNGVAGHGMASVFVTSGRGITTTTGRVMFLLDAKVQTTSSPEQNYLLYSDNEGQTWTIAPTLIYDGANEAKLAQLPDGTLLSSTRQSGQRGFNRGTGDGLNWMGQYRATNLPDAGCNADILAYSDGLLLQTLVHRNPRADLRIHASRDHGQTWTEVYQIQAGLGAYTTMERLANGDLAILYEDKSYDAGNGYAINYISIPAETVKMWAPGQAPAATVNISDNTGTGLENRGTFSETSGPWSKVWTSDSRSGVAGFKLITEEPALGMGGHNGIRVTNIKPPTVKGSTRVTLQAPEGYVIEGYEIGMYLFTGGERYDLTSADGTTVRISSTAQSGTTPSLRVNNVNAASTYFTLTGVDGTNNRWSMIPWFQVRLRDINAVAPTPDYAAHVESELKPWFETGVGDLFGLTEEARSTHQSELDARLTTCTLADYLTLRDAVRAGVNYPATGHYRLKNNHWPRWMQQPDGGTPLAGTEENTGGTSVPTIVKLERDDQAGTYAISLQGQYLQSPAQSANVPLGTTPHGFTPVLNGPGKVAFQGTVGSTYTALHMGATQGYRIVGWTATESPASVWRVEELENVDLTDATPYAFASDEAAAVDTIRYTRTFKNTAWQALYLPFAMPYEAWSENFEVAEITGMKQTDEDGDGRYETLTLRGRTLRGGQTEANKAYFIRYTGGEASSTQPAQTTLTVTQGSLNPAGTVTTAYNSDDYEIVLTGTYQTITDMSAKGYWALSGGRLARTTNAAATLSPYRWYMTLDALSGTAVPVKDLRMNFIVGGTETGIEHTRQVMAEAEVAYDLQGRRIAQPKQPGLYIMNRNKIIKK